MFSAASAFALWPSFSARRDLEVPGADIRQHVLTKPHAANHEMLKSLAIGTEGLPNLRTDRFTRESPAAVDPEAAAPNGFRVADHSGLIAKGVSRY